MNNIVNIEKNKYELRLEGKVVKINIIPDIDAIRSNAQLGANAYNTISSFGNIVSYNASDFATANQGSLANTALQPDDNISELKNNVGYITSSSLPTVNNATITFMQGNANKGTITLNQATNQTIQFDAGGAGGDVSWGNIGGQLSDQTDLQAAFNACVSLDTPQTITGDKTFSGVISHINPNMDITVNPGTQQNNQYVFRDKNNIFYGAIQANQGTDGSVTGTLSVRSTPDRSYSSIGVKQTANGETITYAPTPPVDDSSTQIANTGWVKGVISDKADTSTVTALGNSLTTLNNSVVKLAGTQTITGPKGFSGGLFKNSTTIDINTNPSTPQNNQIWFRDKNGVSYATLQTNQMTDGTLAFNLAGKARSANSFASMGLILNPDGTATTQAPTPPLDSNNTNIATTAWVNKRVQLVSAVPASPIAGVLYCIAES